MTPKKNLADAQALMLIIHILSASKMRTLLRMIGMTGRLTRVIVTHSRWAHFSMPSAMGGVLPGPRRVHTLLNMKKTVHYGSIRMPNTLYSHRGLIEESQYVIQ